MFDFIFDGFMAFHAIGFFVGGVIMLLIGGLILGDWALWRLKAERIKARIVGVKASGKRRSEEEWRAAYEAEARQKQAEADENPFSPEEFREKPLASIGAMLFLLLFLMIPVVFFGFGAYTAYDYFSLKNGGVRAQATVVDVEKHYDSESGDTYEVTVSFKDRSGAVQRESDRMQSGSNSYKEGQKLTVYYDSAKPSRFIIDSFWRYMGLALAFMVIGGGILALIFGGLVYKLSGGKVKDPDVRKEIAALKKRELASQYYYPVYEFYESGETVQIDGDTGRNWIAGRMPGKQVTLLRRADKQGEVPRHETCLVVIGLVFAAPGVLFLGLAASQFTFSPAAILMVIAAFGYLGWKLKKIIKPRAEWESRDAFKARMLEKAQVKQEKKASGRYLLTPAELRARVRALDRYALFTTPLVVLFAVGMMAGGVHVWRDMDGFSAHGIAAQGQIVSFDTRRDSEGSVMYYPRIRFTAQDGRSHDFQDNVGSNAPLGRVGDAVNVLYDSGNPRRAVVNRGWLNWLLPAALMAAGALLLWWALKMLAGIMHRARRV